MKKTSVTRPRCTNSPLPPQLFCIVPTFLPTDLVFISHFDKHTNRIEREHLVWLPSSVCSKRPTAIATIPRAPMVRSKTNQQVKPHIQTPVRVLGFLIPTYKVEFETTATDPVRVLRIREVQSKNQPDKRKNSILLVITAVPLNSIHPVRVTAGQSNPNSFISTLHRRFAGLLLHKSKHKRRSEERCSFIYAFGIRRSNRQSVTPYLSKVNNPPPLISNCSHPTSPGSLSFEESYFGSTTVQEK